ncbi:MAG: TonB-dependent receptor, partial [Bacteroidaceae bacterium]|nr:TonB-dependent receptor [Bacteroidaceae bacterium]
MKHIIFFFACSLVIIASHAQRITREYNNVSFSEALRQLSEESKDYSISFLYDELEDFRITTAVSAKNIPDAIRQMIGFYPIRMEVQDKDIAVECVQKATSRYKGTIIDEQGRAVGYANVMLLSTKDSAFITGGVSNESGLFVIPCEQQPVLARISFVGYKTVYKICHTTDIGTIRMQPDTYTLGNVTVRGERPNYQMGGHGLTVNVQGTMLSEAGTAND